LREILKRIVDCQPLQLEQALEMVEDPFEVEVRRPFGEEISSEIENGQIGEGNPRAQHRKRPARVEGDEPPVKKTRQNSKGGKGKNPYHREKYTKYLSNLIPFLMNMFFKNVSLKTNF
jgi:hypothetical protein